MVTEEGQLPILAVGYYVGLRRGVVLLADNKGGPVSSLTRAEIVGQVVRAEEAPPLKGLRGGKLYELPSRVTDTPGGDSPPGLT